MPRPGRRVLGQQDLKIKDKSELWVGIGAEIQGVSVVLASRAGVGAGGRRHMTPRLSQVEPPADWNWQPTPPHTNSMGAENP